MKAYPVYKESGVDWLGEVPNHWSLPKISYLMNYIGSGTTPRSTNEEYYDGDIPWVTTGELREGIIFDTKKKITRLAVKENTALKSHPVNSIVMAMYGATIGRLAMLGIEATTNQACCVLPPTNKVRTEFLYYWLMCHRNEIIELSYGGGQPNISQDTVANLRVSLPTNEEQKTIVSYLDFETTRIDTLISEKQSFIKLLKEKRQALISHVVTKGLDDNVKMKPSGVEWIGDIPEHWETSTLRRHTEEHKQGYYTTNDYVDDGLKLLRITDLRKFGSVDFSNCPKVPVESSQETYLLENGDFVFARTGGAGSFGLIQNLDEKVIFASYLIRFRFKKSLAPRFIAFALQSKPLFVEITKNMHGGVNQNIHAENIKDAVLAYPSLEEQNAIADYLSLEIPKFEILEKEVNESIELLKEHRTALISAAVTGKIDVREAV